MTAPVVVSERRFPPVTERSMAVLALLAAGGVFIASYVPRRAPLAVPIVLAAVATALLLWNVVDLARLRPFARDQFALVAKWVLVAYVVEAGMILFAFVHNDMPGGQLAVFAWMLTLFALDVPIVVGFTVARYADTSPAR